MARRNDEADRKVAYFFGVVLLSLTGLCIWLMADVPTAPTQEVEREIAYESLVKN
jgi:hypothetical protein